MKYVRLLRSRPEIKILAVILLGLTLLGVAALACPTSSPCPIHDYSTGYFTGQTRIIDGVLVGTYNCPRGHTFLVRCN